MSNRPIVETSQEAFKALQPEQLRQTYKDILFALTQLKEGTTEQIADALRVPHAKIHKRVSEMARMGLIHRPGTKRPLKSGKNGFTWKITNPGESTAPVTEKALPGKSFSDFSKKLIPTQTKLF